MTSPDEIVGRTFAFSRFGANCTGLLTPLRIAHPGSPIRQESPSAPSRSDLGGAGQ
jgi:hypothetical protein